MSLVGSIIAAMFAALVIAALIAIHYVTNADEDPSTKPKQ